MKATPLTLPIAILCAARNSHYYTLAEISHDLDIYDQARDARTFKGKNKIIAHPPCAQWSKLKGRARYDREQKEIANFCFDMVLKNGGIFEHPAGSAFFKYRGVKPTAEINQLWFGFPARKATWLYFHKCEPLLITHLPTVATRQVNNMNSESRALMPIMFCEYLINCVNRAGTFYDTFPKSQTKK